MSIHRVDAVILDAQAVIDAPEDLYVPADNPTSQ